MKMVFGNRYLLAIAGAAIGVICVLTEKRAEYNWVFALLLSIVFFSLIEGFNALTTEGWKYDWRNPVTAVAATAISIFVTFLVV